MEYSVDPNYRVDVFLDTNVLEDYLEKTHDEINRCIDFLSECPFVTLRASHYVEFELTEVRKARLFEYVVNNTYSESSDIKLEIKKNWRYRDYDYSKYKERIEKQVLADLQSLRDLNINFDDNVLHDDLLTPVQSLILRSKLSREDSMVGVSCVYPNANAPIIPFSALISSDRQFHKAYNDNSHDIIRIISDLGAKPSIFLFTRNMQIADNSLGIDLYNYHNKVDVVIKIREMILNLIMSKNKDKLLGKSYRFSQRGKASDNVVFFKIAKGIGQLKSSSGLALISKNLDYFRIIRIDSKTYRNEGKRIVLPYKDYQDSRFSVEANEINEMLQDKINSNAFYIFYNND